MKFQEGDRVILINLDDYNTIPPKGKYREQTNNPLWDGKYGHVIGTVISSKNTLKFTTIVKWDNGITNTYNEKNLEFRIVYSELMQIPDEMFEI